MAAQHHFGRRESHVRYTLRRAAYVVVRAGDRVAMVKSGTKHFLPGGGSGPCETPEETVVREVSEELARGVRLLCKIGEAVQYFYADADDRHYRMLAHFFTGEFTDEPSAGAPEHELVWLPVRQAEHACFHACHAWAVRQA